MTKTLLKGNNAFSWTKAGNYYFIGFCFDGDKLLTGDDAITFLVSNSGEVSVSNGIYSLICITESEIKIWVDSINYFPVFFLFNEKTWVISDYWDDLIKEKGSFTPKLELESEFLNAGYVLGNNTIDNNILKTKSGYTTILKSSGEVELCTNWSFTTEKFLSESRENIIESTYTEFQNASQRMISFLNGRTAVLPLSGGFDSRLIACMLKDCSYTDVICFTYGKPNAEVDISKKVAATLGYKWHFINYQEINTSGFENSEDFAKYIKIAGNGFSMPYLQEYFAVQYLKENNLIPADSVFLPGHSGDFLGGSYVNKTAKTKVENDKLAAYLFDKYYWFFEKKDKGSIISRLDETIDYPPQNNLSDIYNPYIEDWDIKEKLAKFIFHSSSVFNHFGYQHYFPLWDLSLVNHFRKIPFELRQEKTLYDEVLISKYFKIFEVYYNEKELTKSKKYKKYQKIKDSIRHHFPWKYVLKRMTESDWMNYSEFCKTLETKIIKEGATKTKRYKAFNAVICKWYLHQLGFYKSL